MAGTNSLGHSVPPPEINVNSLQNPTTNKQGQGRRLPEWERAMGHMKEPTQSEQARLQLLWEKTQLVQNFVNPTRYDKVAVLLLSWDNTYDDLGTSDEVSRLAEVFGKKFYDFEVREVKLNQKERAQIQMAASLVNFVREFERNSESVLLIIYYAGHGWAQGAQESAAKHLYLAGSAFFLKITLWKLTVVYRKVTQATENQEKRNRIMWKEAEQNIKDAEADVLLIFDCCHAGWMCRSNEPHRYEVLAACTADAKTHIPGESSFTSALIWALKKLYNRKDKPYFRTTELVQAITECPQFPQDQHPFVKERVHETDHIALAPRASEKQPLNNDIEKGEQAQPPVKISYYDLRFHANDLSDEELISFGTKLKELAASRQLPAHRVSLLGKNSVWKSHRWQAAAAYGNIWREHTKRAKRRRLSHMDAKPSNLSANGQVTPVSPSYSGRSGDAVDTDD
ncbi:MAG: hypothetical protein M1821_007754 [Bathelium mastoideum]|nr:MAG: hypothetical protein M1821_007754 [Bathelium mastoideum]